MTEEINVMEEGAGTVERIVEEVNRIYYDKVKDRFGEWAPLFKPFIEGEQMWKIYEKIREDSKTDTIVPKSSDTFRAFSTTHPHELKVVFYLMDPYPKRYKEGLYQATGIAMDCSNSPTGKLQPSLELFYDAIERDLGKKVEQSPNLEYLHQQGVMLLNTDLTCKLNKTESHKGLWEPFQKYFLQEVLRSKYHIIYVLCGKNSKKMEKYIPPFCRVFKLEHPVAASYAHTHWEHEGVFNKINRILKDNSQREIRWDKKDWDSYSKAPF